MWHHVPACSVQRRLNFVFSTCFWITCVVMRPLLTLDPVVVSMIRRRAPANPFSHHSQRHRLRYVVAVHFGEPDNAVPMFSLPAQFDDVCSRTGVGPKHGKVMQMRDSKPQWQKRAWYTVQQAHATGLKNSSGGAASCIFSRFWLQVSYLRWPFITYRGKELQFKFTICINCQLFFFLNDRLSCFH